MAIFGKSTKQKDENKKVAEKAATKASASKSISKMKESKKPAKSAKTEMVPAVVAPAIKSASISAETAAKANKILLAPHITEKANSQSEKNNVYTFKVAENATKHSIVNAVKKDYKITPIDVRLVTIPRKGILYRGRPAFKSGYKKAYISLKKGDKIDFAA